MWVSAVVQVAEAATGVLIVVLGARMLLLYRASVVSDRAPQAVPALMHLPRPESERALPASEARPAAPVAAEPVSPRAILEDYIGELMGMTEQAPAEPREESPVRDLGAKGQAQTPSVAPPDTTYQPIAAFLSSRCDAAPAGTKTTLH